MPDDFLQSKDGGTSIFAVEITEFPEITATSRVENPQAVPLEDAICCMLSRLLTV